jgi:hypothetical protein
MAPLLLKRQPVAVWVISCITSQCVLSAFGAEPLALPPDISLWDKSLNLRVGLGYKDNLLLSDLNHEESPFVSTEVEATLLRLPVDGTQVLAFVSAEDTRYWNGHRLPKEQLFFGQVQVKREFARDWNFGLTAQAIYNDTVFDASITETNLTPVPAVSYSFKAAPFLRRDFGKKYWVELEFGVNRQYFTESLDDYWEIGPKITVGRNYGNRSSIAFSYLFNQRSYDDRTPVNLDQSPVPGKTLEYWRHELELAIQHNWDKERRWRMTTGVGWEYNEDNGSGYFNYFHYRVYQQVRYVAKLWELKAQARFNPYYYPNQFATTDSSDKRYKNILTLNLRGERKLTQKIKLFAEYEYEQAYSNETLSEYQANRVIGGIDWEF